MLKTRVAVVLLAIGSSFHAQGTQGPLATVRAIKCSFTLMSATAIKEDAPKAEIKSTKREIEFEDINQDESTAVLKSGFGDYDIIVRYAPGYLHFIQAFRDGPLYITTVLEQRTRDGRFKAIHSRHEFTSFALPGYTSSPEQYYGDCEVVKGAD